MLNTPTNSQKCLAALPLRVMAVICLTVSMSQLNGELTRQTVRSEMFASNVGGGSSTASRREEKLRRRRSRSGADDTSSVPSPLFNVTLPTNTSQARRSGSTMAADLRASLMPSAGSRVWHRSPAHSANVIAQSPLLSGVDGMEHELNVKEIVVAVGNNKSTFARLCVVFVDRGRFRCLRN